MSVVVKYGDEGYSTLYDKWVSEGSPSGQFDRLGEFGGELWIVRGDLNGYPNFHLRAAAGPTDPGHDKDIESWRWADQSSGFLVEMPDTGLEITEGPGGEGDLRLKVEHFPLDESVWAP